MHLLNQLHPFDCFDGLRRLPPTSVDLVFADLPYGSTHHHWDAPLPIAVFWHEVRRIAKPDAPIVLTSVQPFTSLLVASNLNGFRYEVIWKKNRASGFLNARRQPLRVHENVVVFSEKPPRHYHPQKTVGHAVQYAQRQAPHRSASKTYQRVTPVLSYTARTTDRYPTSVLCLSGVPNGTRIHPMQKPEDLPAWFIATHTKKGDVVLDPVCGSGSTLVAAKRLGRFFVGFDTDADVLAKARTQLAQVAGTRLP